MRFVELFLGGFYGNSGGRKARFFSYFLSGLGGPFENFFRFFFEVFQVFFRFLAKLLKRALILVFYSLIVEESILFKQPR